MYCGSESAPIVEAVKPKSDRQGPCGKIEITCKNKRIDSCGMLVQTTEYRKIVRDA